VADTVIRVADVSKHFRIRKDKSLKERIVNAGRGRKHAEEFWALRDIGFEVSSGSTLGLIGHNGSGKSTLLKVIGGILTPDTGYVERRGRLAALLELGAGFHEDLTGRENVYLNGSILGLSRKQIDRYFEEIVDFSGIERFIDTQVKFYSSGMYVRLAFSVAVHVDPEILLVDEVLAVGDEPFQRKCMERIKQFQRDGRTIAFVTHSLDQVRQLCDRVIMLDGGQMIIDGTPVEALRAFRDRYAEQAGVEPEEGSRRLEVIKTTVTDGDGHPKDRFAPGDDLAVEIDVQAHEPTARWVVTCSFTNQLDLLVYGTNSDLRGVELGPIDGQRRVRFLFRDIPLVEGQYLVSIAVRPPDGPEYHVLERTVGFSVFSAEDDHGVVHMSPQVEVIA
jgi:ABC-2 type transport system ATP-binding protein